MAEPKQNNSEVAHIAIGAVVGAVLCLGGGLLATHIAKQYGNTALGGFSWSLPWQIGATAGEYELTGYVENGVDKTSNLSTLKAFGFQASLTLNDDKTGTLMLFGASRDITYDDTVIVIDGVSNAYSFENNSITFKDGNDELTFTKKD